MAEEKKATRRPRKHSCFVCHEHFTEGVDLRLLATSLGDSSKRRQISSLIASICNKCAAVPGSRRTRPVIYRGLYTAAQQSCARLAANAYC
jgi:hypothetical protein